MFRKHYRKYAQNNVSSHRRIVFEEVHFIGPGYSRFNVLEQDKVHTCHKGSTPNPWKRRNMQRQNSMPRMSLGWFECASKIQNARAERKRHSKQCG